MNNGKTPSGPPDKPIMAQIVINLHPDMTVSSGMQGRLSRALFNMMLETGKQDLLANILQAERGHDKPRVVLPPAGIDGKSLRAE